MIIRTLIFLLFFIPLHAQKPLVVGMELSYPPFETIDKEGNPKGISVDLAYALGKYLDRPVVIENIPYVGLIPALKTKKIDLIISSLTVTKERAKSIAFSDPYHKIHLAFLTPIDSPIQSIDELNQVGKTVVVKRGTTSEVYAHNHLKLAKVIVLEKEAAAVMEIIQKKADGFIYDKLSIFHNWQKHKDKTRALLDPIQTEEWAIGLRKEDTELLAQVNAFLKKYPPVSLATSE